MGVPKLKSLSSVQGVFVVLGQWTLLIFARDHFVVRRCLLAQFGCHVARLRSFQVPAGEMRTPWAIW